MTLASPPTDTNYATSSFRAALGKAVKATRKGLGLRNVEGFKGFLEKKGVFTSTTTLSRLEQGRAIEGEIREQVVEALGLSESFPPSKPVTIAPPIEGEGGLRKLLGELEREVFQSPILGAGAIQSLSFRSQIENALNKFRLNFSSKGQILEWRFPDPTPLEPEGVEFVIGPAGRGKSTFLRASFLTALSRFRGAAGHVPFFYRACDFRLGFRQARQVLERLRGKKILMFIDGVDEISLSEQSLLFDEILALDQTRCAFVLSARPELLWRLRTERWEISGVIDSVVEVMEWEYERDTLPYVAQYAKHFGTGHLVPSFERIGQIAGARALLQKPINVSLMIYLLQHKPGLSGHVESIIGLYALFAEFYERWISRESLRVLSGDQNPQIWSQIERQHDELALHFFQRPFEALALTGLKEDDPVISNPAFGNLLIFNSDPKGSAVSIRGFSDDSFVDFLVARRLVKTLREREPAVLLAALTIEYTNNVNTFVRSHFQTMSNAERAHSKEALSKCLSLAEQTDSIIAAEQAVYYLGRVGGAAEPPILEEIFRTSSNHLIRRSAGLGAILYGNTDVDLEYSEHVLSDDVEDRLNRSVQLLYFEDDYGSIFGYRDDGRVSWDRTRKAITDRLKLFEGRSLQLRLWDLTTFHCFQRSRPQVRLSRQEIVALEQCRNNDPSLHRSARINSVTDAILRLDSKRAEESK